MIYQKTVFIIGAGANVTYGFPLGSKLIESIIDELSFIDYSNHKPDYKIRIANVGNLTGRYQYSSFQLYLKNIGFSDEQVEDFKESLIRAKPRTIDTYLNTVPKYKDIGKLAIARVISSCESENLVYSRNLNDDWYRFVWHKIIENSTSENLAENNVKFITFNYDRSLEYYFYNCLKCTFQDLTEQDIGLILQRFGFVHIYGQLGYLGWEELKPIISYGQSINHLDSCSEIIKIFSENIDSLMSKLNDAFYKADKVLFIGFGYHDLNLQRFDKFLPNDISEIKGTSYGLSNTFINDFIQSNSYGIDLAPKEYQIVRFLEECVDLS